MAIDDPTTPAWGVNLPRYGKRRLHLLAIFQDSDGGTRQHPLLSHVFYTYRY